MRWLSLNAASVAGRDFAMFDGCGDGKSQNDAFPKELSGSPGPQNESSQKHSVPAFIHPSYYALYNTIHKGACIRTGVGGRDVLKRCVLIRSIWNPWSPR